MGTSGRTKEEMARHAGLLALQQQVPWDVHLTSGEDIVTACRHVLYVTGNEGGFEPGSYFKALIFAMLKADTYHQSRLSFIYPQLVAAVKVFKNVEGGIELLKAVAQP